MNVRIRAFRYGETIVDKTIRYAELKRIRTLTIPLGEYLIVLEVVGER